VLAFRDYVDKNSVGYGYHVENISLYQFDFTYSPTQNSLSSFESNSKELKSNSFTHQLKSSFESNAYVASFSRVLFLFF
jgi:hypothetical protein